MLIERLQWGSVRVDNALWLKPVLEKTGSAATAAALSRLIQRNLAIPPRAAKVPSASNLLELLDGCESWYFFASQQITMSLRFETGRVWNSAVLLHPALVKMLWLTRQIWWEHIVDWNISFIVNLANSQMCVIAAASHPLQIHQTPLVMLQILQRHFQMLHGIRESFHMTAVEGKSEDRSSFTSTLP